MRIKKLCVWTGVCLLASFATLTANESPINWVRDLDEAKRIAQTEKKDLLINFTGREWCGACVELDRKVLSKPEFASAANDFVLVEIDYPGNDERLEGAMKEWFPKVRDYYMVTAYPTVIVADSDGLPVAYVAGWSSEGAAGAFLKKLAAYRAGRQARDAALADAAKMTGAARAKKLDDALQAVSSNLGSIYSRRVDPLFAFYENVVNEIKSLDKDSLAARYYEQRAAVRQEWENRPGATIVEELRRRFKGPEDAPAAIEYIDQALARVQDQELRWLLEMVRMTEVEWSSLRQGLAQEEKDLIYENALKNAARLVSITPKDHDVRDRALRHQAFMLMQLRRADEMVAVCDGRISDSVDQAKRRNWLRFKAVGLQDVEPGTDRAIAAYRDFCAATEPRSNIWRLAAEEFGVILEQAGRKKEAIEFRQQALAVDPENISHWFCMARDQQALGLLVEARKSLDEAEARAPAWVAKNKRLETRQAIFKEEVAKLRKLLEPAPNDSQ